MIHYARRFAGPILLSVLFVSTNSFAFENPDVETAAAIEQARRQIAVDFAHAVDPERLSSSARTQILADYANLDPKHEVPSDLLAQALVYFTANRAGFPNAAYLTVVDFKPRSDHYRFFLIDMKTGLVEKYHTTHGDGSDPKETGYAQTFGNVLGSGKSSLGFIRTGEIYSGIFGRAVRIDGLSTTNSQMRARAVVIHGWDYAKEADVIQETTNGCMALDWKVKDGIIGKIKGGSLIYAGVSSL